MTILKIIVIPKIDKCKVHRDTSLYCHEKW